MHTLFEHKSNNKTVNTVFLYFYHEKLKNMNQNSKLFLLDAYALIYRAYYAFIKNPRINSKGFNTSAILGFVNTLEEVLKKENPTHIGVAFDPRDPHSATKLLNSTKLNEKKLRKQSVFRYLL